MNDYNHVPLKIVAEKAVIDPAELAALRKDAERLDWALEHVPDFPCTREELDLRIMASK